MSNQKDKAAKQHRPEATDNETPEPKSYYYDDSTGYETYDPESEDDDANSDQDP